MISLKQISIITHTFIGQIGKFSCIWAYIVNLTTKTRSLNGFSLTWTCNCNLFTWRICWILRLFQDIYVEQHKYPKQRQNWVWTTKNHIAIYLEFTYRSWCSNSCMIMLAIGSVMGRSPSNRCRSGSACIWAKEPSPKVISKWGEMERLSSSAAINHQTVVYRIKPLIS